MLLVLSSRDRRDADPVGHLRSREFGADEGAARITGRPLALASALQKIEYAAERMPMDVNPAASQMYIVNPMGGDLLKSVAGLFRTHPQTADRIARLQALAGGTR